MLDLLARLDRSPTLYGLVRGTWLFLMTVALAYTAGNGWGRPASTVLLPPLLIGVAFGVVCGLWRNVQRGRTAFRRYDP